MTVYGSRTRHLIFSWLCMCERNLEVALYAGAVWNQARRGKQ